MDSTNCTIHLICTFLCIISQLSKIIRKVDNLMGEEPSFVLNDKRLIEEKRNGEEHREIICPIEFFDDMEVECVIPGKPFAKQRPRASRRGHLTVIYTPKETINYENLVKSAWYNQNGLYNFGNDPLEAEVIGFFPTPHSCSKKQQSKMLEGEIKYTKKPDCDNMAKIVLDALNDIAYDDDSQIVSLKVQKLYGEPPHTVVKLKRISKE